MSEGEDKNEICKSATVKDGESLLSSLVNNLRTYHWNLLKYKTNLDIQSYSVVVPYFHRLKIVSIFSIT